MRPETRRIREHSASEGGAEWGAAKKVSIRPLDAARKVSRAEVDALSSPERGGDWAGAIGGPRCGLLGVRELVVIGLEVCPVMGSREGAAWGRGGMRKG